MDQPIIAQTVFAQIPPLVEAFKARLVDDFLEKPFALTELIAKIVELLQKSEHRSKF
jgi:FixJ family two-component response regulator